MKEKIYVGHTLQEVEELAVKELGVAKEDLYFDVLTPEEVSRDEIQVHVMVDANPIKKAKDYLETFLQNANIMGYVERKMRDNVVEYSVSTDGANTRSNAVPFSKDAMTSATLLPPKISKGAID